MDPDRLFRRAGPYGAGVGAGTDGSGRGRVSSSRIGVYGGAFSAFCASDGRRGDIKLMAVMAGFLGRGSGFQAITYGCVVGACLALAKLLLQGILWQRLNYLLAYFRRLFRTKEIVPYYRAERDGYGVVIPFAFCLFVGYMGYLLL